MAELQALRKSFSSIGIALDDSLSNGYHDINGGLWRALERGETTIPHIRKERFRRLFAARRIPFDPDDFAERFVDELGRGIFPLDGAVDICRYISSRARIVVLTNGIRDVQLPRVLNSPIAGFVSDIVVSEEAGASKPSPAMFEFAASRAGFFDKAAMLMVGDSLSSDIAGGIAYGIDTCWYNPGKKPGTDGPDPTYEIRHLVELKDIL